MLIRRRGGCSADSDGDGVISESEAEGLVGVINQATGSSLSAADFLRAGDKNGNGTFSVDEAVSTMKAHRPEAAPEDGATGTTQTDPQAQEAIFQYLQMLAMGQSQNDHSLASLLTGQNSTGSRVA